MEQTIQHRNAELLAVQKKLDKLDSLYKSRTEELLEQQQVTLTQFNESSEAVIETKKTEIIELEEALNDLIAQNDKLQSVINNSTDELEIIQQEVSDNQNQLERQQEAHTEISNQVYSLNSTKNTIELEISNLEDKRVELQKLVKLIEERIPTIKTKLEALESEFSQKEAEKQTALNNLDSKLLELTQAIEQNQDEVQRTRNELAIWQKKLEEQDENLRIREAKVSLGENKLIRNSQLLNL